MGMMWRVVLALVMMGMVPALAMTAAPAAAEEEGRLAYADLVAEGPGGVRLDERIHFDFDRLDVNAAAAAVLDRAVALLTAEPELRLTIQSHSGDGSSREYNLGLASRRADSVQDYIRARGIAPSRITAISFGEERMR